MSYQPDQIVKSCWNLESGLRLGEDGVRACCMGALVSPLYWSPEQVATTEITKDKIIEKRKQLFDQLNDSLSDISCKHCLKVERKPYSQVSFDRLGHVNLAHFSYCNLRCEFCGFTQHETFKPPEYDALAILGVFSKEDVEWNAFVDLNGGEPTLLKDLDAYIDYFKSRGIRILLYTNAVRFQQSVWDGLADGSISWLITSLDAGTPSTFRKTKGRDHFQAVLDNLTRYAQAGSQGGGMLAVKYVFCDSNCGEDDLAGFTYAMLAIRPQRVWLTFDFFPLADRYPGQTEVGVYDYSRHIQAYARMYLSLKKHGLEAVHFNKTHLGKVIQRGKDILDNALETIERLAPSYALDDPSLRLEDFRRSGAPDVEADIRFDILPLTRKEDDQDLSWSLAGKRLLIAPACAISRGLLSDPGIREAELLGFLDRNPMMRGRDVDGFPIHGYEAIPELEPDLVLVAAPSQHTQDIVNTIANLRKEGTRIAVLDQNP